MAFRRYESILTECLDAMRLGVTVEDCLERYPRQAERLRPAVLLAERVSRTPPAQVRPNAQAVGWKKIEKRLAELQSGRQPVTFIPSAMRGGNYIGWLKPVAISAVAVLAVSAVGGGTVLAAQSATPSSPLYRLKLAGEDARIWFIADDAHKANILLDQSRQRMEEINGTVKDGDAVPENALSAMENRNRRALEILHDQPENTELRARVLSQATEQEDRLLALWQEVPVDAHDSYTEVVADLHNTQLDGGTGAAVAALQPEELTGGILTISGQLENAGGDQWRVGGFEVRIDSQTLRDQPQSGGTATVLVARSSNGRLHALNLSNILAGSPDSSSSFVSGAVEEVTDEGVRIAGQWIPFDSDTLQTSPIRQGQKVQVVVKNTSNGVVAGQVNPSSTNSNGANTLWFEGTIQGDVSRATSRWTVGGLQFDVTPSTGVDARAGSAASGARVQIEAVANADGELLAQRVTVISSKAAGDTSTIIGTFGGYIELGIWSISGLPVTASPDIPDENDPPEGALIIADAHRQGDDLVVTGFTIVETPGGPSLVQVEGTILETHGSRWTLEIGQVHVPSTTKVIGKVESGKRVMVWGSRGDDGIIEGTVARVLDDAPIARLPSEPAPTQVPPVTGAAP